MTQLRADLAVIASLIPEGASVLDVGCGEGDLLAALKTQKHVKGRGLELSQANVNRCIARGLSVIQGDADTDLTHYPDNAFDIVVLSQTLQTLRAPKDVLEALVRIGKQAIVSVPNFGHWKNRLYLSWYGRMPVTKTLSHSWHDTPNIHFCTIRDFVVLCESLNLSIEKRLFVTHAGHPAAFEKYGVFANFFGEQGVFVVGKN